MSGIGWRSTQAVPCSCRPGDGSERCPREAECEEAYLMARDASVWTPDPDAPSRRLDAFQADIDNLNLTGREADGSSGPAAPTAG